MHNKFFLPLLLLIFTFGIAGAQGVGSGEKGETVPLKDLKEATKLADKVMQKFVMENYYGGFDDLSVHWPMDPAEIERLAEKTAQYIPMASVRYGELLEYTFLKDEKVSDFLYRKTYVMRFEYHILKMHFTYYRGKDGWWVNGFTWNDEIDELFGE